MSLRSSSQERATAASPPKPQGWGVHTAVAVIHAPHVRQARIIGSLLVLVLVALAFPALASGQGGEVTRWGWYGDGPSNEQDLPTAVGGLTNVVSIRASNSFSLALRSNGTVWAWGNDANGQLGNDILSDLDYPTPVEVPIPAKVVSIGEGKDFGMAVDARGRGWVWGLNSQGQLCLGNTRDQLVPVVALKAVAAAAGGDQHALWLRSDGTVVGCGQNEEGQLGDGQFTDSTTPVGTRITGVASISSGSEFSEATEKDGSVWMWGNNSSGQLGVGNIVSSDLPERVPLQAAALDVSCGGNYPSNGHCLTILSDGTVWAWGNNSSGQLGDGSTTNRARPVQITPPPGVSFVEVAAGGVHSLALDTHGNVWAWGDNTYGELGDNQAETYSTTPIEVLSGQTMIWTTAHNNLAL